MVVSSIRFLLLGFVYSRRLREAMFFAGRQTEFIHGRKRLFTQLVAFVFTFRAGDLAQCFFVLIVFSAAIGAFVCL